MAHHRDRVQAARRRVGVNAPSDDHRGCILLGNWILVALGVACVAMHAGTIAALLDTQERHEWDGLAVRLLTIPSALVGATLCIAASARKVVPHGIRVVEALLVALMAAGTVVEFLTVR